jgi:hypothetical protein
MAFILVENLALHDLECILLALLFVEIDNIIKEERYPPFQQITKLAKPIASVVVGHHEFTI